MATKIGIFGGTFDPFTIAHYAIVKNILANNLVDKVIVMPTTVSYYRNGKSRLFCDKSKVDIIEKWLENEKDIILDTHEFSIARDENRRYFNMLDYVIEKYSTEGDDVKFYTIIGGDSYNNLSTWTNYEHILEKSDLIVVSRGEKLTANFKNATILNLGDAYERISASNIRDAFLNKTITTEDFKTEYLNFIPEMKKQVEIEKTLVHTPIFDLREVENENYPFKPIRVRSKDWVTVVVKKGSNVLAVKQMRYGINKEMIEFPCGMVEDGEHPEDAALRELKEETGYTVDKSELKYLGAVYANPAFMTNKMHYFFVDLETTKYEVGDTQFDEHENLTSKWVNVHRMRSQYIMSVFMLTAFHKIQNLI